MERDLRCSSRTYETLRKFPKPDALIETLYRNLTSPLHTWVDLQVLSSDDKDGIELQEVCLECRSKRFKRARFSGTYWIVSQRSLLHSDKWETSLCHRKFWKWRVPFKHGKSKNFQCPVCLRLFFYLAEAAECEEKCRRIQALKLAREQWRQDQITKNLKIINEVSEVWRVELAIYRLYRYFDFRPDKIAEMIDMRTEYVKAVIGRTFKKLCLYSSQCPFKQYFQGVS